MEESFKIKSVSDIEDNEYLFCILCISASNLLIAFSFSVII